MYRKCIFCGWGRKQVNDTVKFYAVPSTPGLQRMNWMHILGEKCKSGLRKADSVCSVHFYKGKPSTDPSHPDFLPHLYLEKNSVPNDIMQKSLRGYRHAAVEKPPPPRRRRKQPELTLKERAMTPAQRAARRARLAAAAAAKAAEAKAEPQSEELEEEEEAPSTSKTKEEQLKELEVEKAKQRILDRSRPLRVYTLSKRPKEVKKEVKQEEPDPLKEENTKLKTIRTVAKARVLRRPPLVVIRSPEPPPPMEIFVFEDGTVDNEVIIDGDSVTVCS